MSKKDQPTQTKDLYQYPPTIGSLTELAEQRDGINSIMLYERTLLRVLLQSIRDCEDERTRKEHLRQAFAYMDLFEKAQDAYLDLLRKQSEAIIVTAERPDK